MSVIPFIIAVSMILYNPLSITPLKFSISLTDYFVATWISYWHIPKFIGIIIVDWLRRYVSKNVLLYPSLSQLTILPIPLPLL